MPMTCLTFQFKKENLQLNEKGKLIRGYQFAGGVYPDSLTKDGENIAIKGSKYHAVDILRIQGTITVME